MRQTRNVIETMEANFSKYITLHGNRNTLKLGSDRCESRIVYKVSHRILTFLSLTGHYKLEAPPKGI